MEHVVYTFALPNMEVLSAICISRSRIVCPLTNTCHNGFYSYNLKEEEGLSVTIYFTMRIITPNSLHNDTLLSSLLMEPLVLPLLEPFFFASICLTSLLNFRNAAWRHRLVHCPVGGDESFCGAVATPVAPQNWADRREKKTLKYLFETDRLGTNIGRRLSPQFQYYSHLLHPY